MARTAHTKCDECGIQINKAKRVENNIAYCSKCYKRYFVRTKCSICEKPTIAHKNDPNPVCRTCRKINRLCARCGRPTPLAHLKIGKAVFCKSCAHYFREEKICAWCGRKVTRLSRSEKYLITEPVCDSCYRSSFVTCSVCHRYRELGGTDDSGKPICVECFGRSSSTHLCPNCNTIVPGQGNSLCFNCSLKNRVERRIKLNLELLEQEWSRELYLAFTQRFITSGIYGSATRKIDRFAEYFHKIDRELKDPEEITQEKLFCMFGKEGLRRGYLITNFLINSSNLEWSDEKFENLVEMDWIEKILCAHIAEPWYSFMRSYYEELNGIEQKNNKPLKLKTIRLYLYAACELFDFAEIKAETNITSKHVLAFYRKKPGHAASLRRFLNFVEEKLSIRLPVKKRKEKMSQIRKERILLEETKILLEGIKSCRDFRKARSYFAKLISVLYQIPLSEVLKLKWVNVGYQDKPLVLNIGSDSIKIDNRLASYFFKWFVRDYPDKFLFQGRNSNRHLSVDVVRYQVNMLLSKHST